ncbi:peroxisomal sarcosine oxidase-like [Halichondria panicea]|uniref:peroxisomal sarcosine oxidase-like n=1 Tax=Halichondria panicea TaxID=6063 RepID=UPI00312B614E
MDYDVIVVGAGVEGSSTAYQLIKNGIRRVLLLEQFHALHTRGSSHGESRLLRKALAPNNLRVFSKMVTVSLGMFDELQSESGKEIYCPSDHLYIGSKTNTELKIAASNLLRNGITKPILSAKQVNQRYNSQLCLPDDFIGVLEPDMMIINIVKVVTQYQKLFMRGGGVLLDNHCVTDIVPGDRVIVRTNKGDFISRKVVITAGAWAPKLISKLGVQLPIKTLRAEVFYWKVENPKHFKPEVFPCVAFEDGKEHFYIFPEIEYPGLLKVYHRTYRDIEVDNRDEGGAGPESVEKVVQFIKTYLRGVATTPAIFEPCVYSMTDGRIPIIDHVPLYPNIVFAAGMSGNGAMIAPVVGLLLTELTLNKPLSFDLTSFRTKKSKL